MAGMQFAVEGSLGIDFEKGMIVVLMVALELVLDKIQMVLGNDDARMDEMSIGKVILVVVEGFAWELVENKVVETFDMVMVKIRRIQLDFEYHCEIDVQLVQQDWVGIEHIEAMLLDYWHRDLVVVVVEMKSVERRHFVAIEHYDSNCHVTTECIHRNSRMRFMIKMIDSSNVLLLLVHHRKYWV